jgi:hypothetical protein
MKNIRLVWLLVSTFGSIFYFIIITITFESKSGFEFSVFELILLFLLIQLISLFFIFPIVFFNKIIYSLGSNNELVIGNLLLTILTIIDFIILYFLDFRGCNDFLYIMISYLPIGFLFLNFYLKRNKNIH